MASLGEKLIVMYQCRLGPMSRSNRFGRDNGPSLRSLGPLSRAISKRKYLHVTVERQSEKPIPHPHNKQNENHE